ncbi:MAG: hypothetical protein RLZZ621_1170 [Gemmatimonadota bacterium]
MGSDPSGRFTPPLSVGNVALALIAIACTVLVAKRATAEREPIDLLRDHGTVAASDTAPATAPRLEQALGVATVRDLRGRDVALARRGEPRIIMLNSRSCPWCRKALADIGRIAEGRKASRLTVLTLEGAAEGAPMLAKEQIAGAQLVGPRDESAQIRLTFRYPGTPTFLAVDRNGRVMRTLPGYPIPEEMKRWVAVMVGDSATP